MGDKTPAIVSMLLVLILVWLSHAKDPSGVSKLRAIGDIMRGSTSTPANGAGNTSTNGAQGGGSLPPGNIGGHGY